MISDAIINLGLVGLTCLLLIIYLTKFVFRYKHEYESNPLCTFTVLFCLLIVLLTTFVLPADIFLVSFVKNSDGSFKEWATNHTLQAIDTGLNATYYSLYGITAFLIFIIIPFLHFFNEESESNSRDRLHKAVKYTFGFVLFVIVLLFIGAFLDNNMEPNNIFDKLLPHEEATKLQGAVTLVLVVITFMGFVNVSFYTASGLSSWPIGLLFGTASVSSRYDTVVDQGDLFRSRIYQLREKAQTSRLSTREQEQLDQAEEDLRRLDREETILSGVSDTWSYKLRKLIRPVQIIVGLAFGLTSIVLLASLIIVNVDRVLHSNGPKQGYILLKPTIFNPFEYLCTQAQDLILVGPMPLLVVTAFLVVATISGIRNLGLWLMFARLHRVRVRRTPPQALLFFCITMMLAATAFNLTLYSLAPQYITFGDQHYRSPGSNGTFVVRPCTVDNYHSDCILTRGSKFLMRMMSQVWIFGAVFYWWGWAFVAVGSISFIAYLKRGKRQAGHDVMVEDDDFEE